MEFTEKFPVNSQVEKANNRLHFHEYTLKKKRAEEIWVKILTVDIKTKKAGHKVSISRNICR